MVTLPLLILAVSTAAQGVSSPTPPALTSPRGGRLFISPMGEPFRPASRGESGLGAWFTQADRNHDGQLTIEEMQADADRFFATLDLNGDGEIDPDDINRYESVVVPEISGGSHFEIADPHQGAARYGLLDLPEPVTAADTNFNRGVSREEFRQAAGQRFVALDLDHHGYLTLSGLQSIRPAPPPQPKREVSPAEVPSDGDATSYRPQPR